MIRILIADDHALMRRVIREVLEKESDLQIVAEATNGQEAEILAAQTQPEIVLMDLDMPSCNGFEATERVLACSPHSRIVIFTAYKQEQYALYAMQRGAAGYLTKDMEPDALIRAIRSVARDELCMPSSLAARVLAHLRSADQINVPVSREMQLTRHINDKQSHPPLEQLPQTALPATPIHYKISFSGGQSGKWEPQMPPQPPSALHMQNQQRAMPGERLRLLTEREREVLEFMRKGLKNREIAYELGIAESTVHKHVQNIFEKLKARNRTEAIYLTYTNV